MITKSMTIEQRGGMIGNIIAQLRLAARDKYFSDGDVFLSLAFKDDAELLKIANMVGVSIISP